MNTLFKKTLNYSVAFISALVFFFGFTAAGFVMRLFSKSCHMNVDKSASSYWRVIRALDKDR